MEHDVLEAVRLLAQDAVETHVTIGPLGADGGVACQTPSTAPETTFLRKAGWCNSMTVVFNSKHSDQEVALLRLESIVKNLIKLQNYPNTEDYQITDIQALNRPFFLNKEKDQWLYACSVEVKYMIRSD